MVRFLKAKRVSFDFSIDFFILVQFRVFDLQTVARIVRAGEASSEAERRNEAIA